jgi:hypothetical protein
MRLSQHARSPMNSLAAVFLLSGAAALIFETLWFHQAGLTFGNSVWASSLVLAAFMGGLALGNAAAAHRGSRVGRLGSGLHRLHPLQSRSDRASACSTRGHAARCCAPQGASRALHAPSSLNVTASFLPRSQRRWLDIACHRQGTVSPQASIVALAGHCSAAGADSRSEASR